MSSSPTLPTKHLSIRVPWHDNGWTGTICNNPLANTSCLVRDRIAKRRNDKFEEENAGKVWSDIDLAGVGCHAGENGAFMAPFPYSYAQRHPDYSGKYGEAEIKIPEYSALATPFRWMNKHQIKVMPNESQNEPGSFDPINRFGIPFDRGLEPRPSYTWVEHPSNQANMLNAFASAIEKEVSLIFFYSNDIPLTTDPRRALIGVGTVSFVGDLMQYPVENSSGPGSYVWERNIGHSIRLDDQNVYSGGFLLPYQEIMKAGKRDPSLDMERYVAFVPDEAWESFSYAAEHVSHDTAISALLECKSIFERLTADKVAIVGNWNRCIQWIDEQLNRLWEMRGPYPGMGSVLSAFGIENGTLVAYEISELQRQSGTSLSEDPWDLFERALDKPDRLPSVGRYLGKHQRDLWQSATESDHQRFKLLSRFSITQDQAAKYIDRKHSDAILENPYFLYESDRFSDDGISLRTIDRGLEPDTVVQEKFPLPELANLEGPTDPRRVRAFAVYHLEEASQAEGHSLLSRDLLMERLRENKISSAPFPMNDIVLDYAEQSFDDEIRTVPHGEDKFYQLEYIAKCVCQIHRLKRKLERAHPHDGGHHDWEKFLEGEFRADAHTAEDRELEELSRNEKVTALRKLYRAPLSVLVGRAGTGKTTVLKVLCNAADDIASNVLLLAPTGKARVRMESTIGVTKAQTISQFLYGHGLYDGNTNRYSLAKRGQRIEVPSTVIVDECSMLTEQQLASLLSVVNRARRIILVGDPQQLPPIGTGRPFVDLAEYMSDNHEDAFCELTISRRQRGRGRTDLALAHWFGSEQIPAGEDDIWQIIARGESDHIVAKRWDEPHELQAILLEAISEYLEELAIKADVRLDDERDRFAHSLGGKIGDRTIYPFFDRGRVGDSAESWQILSPVRGEAYGVKAINRAIQHYFQSKVRAHLASPPRSGRKFPLPFGSEGILYGDKVINVVNHRRDNSADTPGGRDYAMFPNGGLGYIANGEIGLVVDHRKRTGRDYTPKDLEVEFASQRGFKYRFQSKEFSGHRTPPLELAYALTIHKSQGSEFGVVFLILPKSSPLLSRELLYTALTRQRERVILLHQGDLTRLRDYADPLHSNIARRITNLFRLPNMQPVVDESGETVFMERGLIHTTAGGVRVRSKSELSLAQEFDARQLEWEYERPLDGRLPDFTIEDPDLGRTVYWEHLGMLHVPHYKQKWEAKRRWYMDKGILPYEDNDGASHVLVATRDGENGGLDMRAISDILDDLFD